MSSEYLETWSYTEKDRKIDELAKQYHELTEAYDRTVCTGEIIKGAILPATARQAALTHINAKQVMRDLVRQAEPHAITEAELKKAILRHRNSG